MLSTIENISFILYVYYCYLNHLFCQILVGTCTYTPKPLHVDIQSCNYYYYLNYIVIHVWYISMIHVCTHTCAHKYMYTRYRYYIHVLRTGSTRICRVRCTWVHRYCTLYRWVMCCKTCSFLLYSVWYLYTWCTCVHECM